MQAFTLAEGATHVAQSAKTSRAAFTLAEVLITLGIIGVVAALTLPTLIANYQKRVYVNQLKKTYSILNQGFLKMRADDGVDLLSETSAYSKLAVFNGYMMSDAPIDTPFYDELKKYFNIVSIETFKQSNNYFYYDLNGYKYPPYVGNVIFLNDGTLIQEHGFFSYDFYHGGITKGIAGYLVVDINGVKNPNTIGRDIFIFLIGNNGVVYPRGSHGGSEIDTMGSSADQYYWRTTTKSDYSCRGNSRGHGCAARVLEEDAMNY
ncbi:MAG: type II secretion system protein [Candidatus Gastranaerophilaceae bacterium]|nr:type II secretion system protein [Candidatus Gastranaerophilaceae bacterium]